MTYAFPVALIALDMGAAVVYAFEPAAAAFFGYFWLGEALTARGWLGGLLLISGMIVSQWNSESRPSAALLRNHGHGDQRQQQHRACQARANGRPGS